MKPIYLSVVAMLLLSNISLSLYSQVNKKDKEELIAILKCSTYKPSIEIDDMGLLHRKDNNGRIYNYNILDISEFKYFFDGNHCILIKLKEGKKVDWEGDGKKGEFDINVFPYENKSDCDKAIEIFNRILKK